MKKLYLDAWNFNKSILIDKLEKYVEENGGELLGYFIPGKIIRTTHFNGNTYGDFVDTNHCDTFNTCTTFVLNGDCFYIELDDNPFFEFHCSRKKVNENNEYYGEYYGQNLNRDWMCDKLMSHSISDEELDEVLMELVETILAMPKSERVRHKKKVRVSNIYDGGYHYEWKDNTDNSLHKVNPRKEMSY